MTNSYDTIPVRQHAPNTWLIAWGGLRARRIAIVVACAAFVVLLFESSGTGLLVGALGLLAALYALRAWRCPRCGDSFAGVRGRWFPLACANCGLAEFAPAETVAAAPARLTPESQSLSPWFRRLLAGSQFVGGALVLSIALLGHLPWTAEAVAEALGFASCLAGVWLWQDHRRGYRYSLVLHAAQLIKVQVAGAVFAVSAGFHVLAWRSATAVGLEPGVSGNFAFAVGASVPRYVAVNLFSLVALVLLLRARSAPSAHS